MTPDNDSGDLPADRTAETLPPIVPTLAELCRRLAAAGESVVPDSADKARVETTITTSTSKAGAGKPDQLKHRSSIQLIWRTDTGSLHLVEVLPTVFAPQVTDELVRTLAFANARLAIPGFQLRKRDDGWKVAYATCVFLDEAGQVSPRAVSEMIKATRLAIRENLLALHALTLELPRVKPTIVSTSEQRDTYDQAETRARSALGALKDKAVPPRPLTSTQRAELVDAFKRNLPRFADRVGSATATDVGQMFLAGDRVVRLDSPLPFPAQTAYAGFRAGEAVVLSGRPAELKALNITAPADSADLMLIVANQAGRWTGSSLLSELRISSVDEIPFRRASDADTVAESMVRRTHGDRISAPALEVLADGIRVTSWLVSEASLRRRVVIVKRSGETTRLDVDVVEETVSKLPVHPGKLWGDVDGRLVPVG